MQELDQGIGPTHSHNQVENALAPLRLCARFSGSGIQLPPKAGILASARQAIALISGHQQNIIPG
jgi:hypothetical protein